MKFKKGAFARALAVVLLASVVGVAGFDGALAARAASIAPLPAGQEQAEDGDGFPSVDWAHLQSANPAIVGWVTVPGTTIDFPVCAASADAPNYWLTHDASGGYNIYGVPFLDADCAGGIEGSRNTVILGHNFHGGRMFAPFADYLDEDFAREHRTVLLQTPTAKYRLKVMAAEAIPGWQKAKVTEFENDGQFLRYVGERLEAADVVLENDLGIERLFTFVTCSYTQWAQNERTCVYCKIEEVK